MDNLIELWDKYKMQCLIIAGLLGVGIYYVASSHGNSFNNNPPVSQAVLASSATSISSQHNSSSLITIDVKGAVKKPGVYELRGDSRINEALKVAGGPLSSADLRQVNLAKQLTDQQMVYIPMQGEQVTDPTVSMAADASGAATNSATSSRVNLNTATKDQLCQVNGIGDKKADLILQYRQEHGQFKSIDELKQINGFGEKTVAKLSDYLSV